MPNCTPIALDGRFYRAALDGAVNEIVAEECTPFAAATHDALDRVEHAG